MDIFAISLLAKTFNIPNWIWLLLGFICSCILNQTPKRVKVISGQKREWLFLSFNFALLLWNAALTVRVAEIAARSSELSSLDLSELTFLADVFLALAFIGVGFLVGEMVFAICQGVMDKRKEKKKETEITISTVELGSLKKKVNEIKKAKTDIDSFLNDIKDDKPKE
jgi:energy-coupling factor transporter transmembrane protein EcfT